LKLSIPKKIVLIGASTGGPGQIEKIINSLPKLKDTTIVIAQHMLDGFLDSFAKRLENNTNNIVNVVKNNQTLQSLNIYICEGNTILNKSQTGLVFSKISASHSSYNPNINLLFNSFVQGSKDSSILCVILTGIGDDGIDACKNLSLNGARCITENEKSAIVDGMPNQARIHVPGIEVHDISEIVKVISEFCE